MRKKHIYDDDDDDNADDICNDDDDDDDDDVCNDDDYLLMSVHLFDNSVDRTREVQVVWITDLIPF
jgi:hypothetical protein